jgi:signal transduction histidine kinase
VADRIAQTVFGLLFDTSTDAAFVVERTHWRVVSANLRTVDLFACELDQLIGKTLEELSFDSHRELTAPGHYEDVSFRGGDGYPVYVALQVAHLDTADHGPVAAFMARDVSERRLLEDELQAKHSALFTAHAELEKAHGALEIAKLELETRNHEIALLAWRAAMGELVAGIAHHLNNPVGALTSTARRLEQISAKLPDDIRVEQTRLLGRIAQIARRIESNVAAIVKASRSNTFEDMQHRPELPPELETVLATFAERMDDIPTKGQS